MSEFQGTRWYHHRGQVMPGVTTVIDTTDPNVGWRIPYGAKHVAERAVHQFSQLRERLNSDDPLNYTLQWLKAGPTERRDAAGDHGSNLHTYLEARMAGTPPSPDLTPAQVAVEQFLAVYRPDPILVETACVNATEGYAGTADGFLKVQGTRLIYDLKTGGHADTEHKVRLQLAAYRYADFVGRFQDEGKYQRHIIEELGPVPEVEAAAVLLIPRDDPLSWQFVEVEAGPVEHRRFLDCLRVWSWYCADEKAPIGTGFMPHLRFVDANKDEPIGEQVLAQTEEVA